MNKFLDYQRELLLAALALVLFLLWNAWQKDYPTAASQPTTIVAQQSASESLPAIPTEAGAVAKSSEATPPSPARNIHITTDVLDVVIDRLGGNIVSVKFPKYPAELKTPNVPFTLLSDDPNALYVAESGLVGNNGPDTAQQSALYHAAKTDYQLSPNQNELQVKLEWQNSAGITVNKLFQFKKGDYLIHVTYQLENHSEKNWAGYFYAQLKRKDVVQASSGLFSVKPFVGAVFSSPEKRYEKMSFDKLREQDFQQNTQNGWAAVLQHYFLSAWIPDSTQVFNYSAKQDTGNIDVVRLLGSLNQVEPGKTFTTTARLYAGPAIADQLKKIAPGLQLTVDYGILWIIATGIFWVMKHIHSIVHNWGWSIVLVTVFIKAIFYKLSAVSYRSMAAMRRLQPKINALKERFEGDKQKLSQAMMELYKTEKINPLSGCLPVLVQIPVFLALYWVLQESVQLRQAPFIFWIRDLSVQDPFYILPIVMGITIFIQQRMNPPPPDPVQAKVMMALPAVFTVLFLTFPAGLVLYWVVNNTLSIAQQWYITKTMDAMPKKKQHKLKK